MCTRNRSALAAGPFRQCGISLIELIMFILIVSIAVAAVMSLLSSTAAHSSDEAARKQAIAVAEGLLEEITSQPYTWCDPDDPSLTTATRYSDCSVQEMPPGKEASEGRYAVPLFDNVNDYSGFAMSGINSVNDGTTVILPDFSSVVTVTEVGTAFGLSDNTAALRIDVLVSGKGETITLTGYRFRHSPNSGG